jgi:hypothetical protein
MASIATGAATAAVRSNGYSGTQNNGGNGPLIVFVEAGLSGTNPTVTATWNGVSMSSVISRGGGTNAGVYAFKLLSPATGSNTLTIAGFTSVRHRVWFVPTNDAVDVRDSDGATTASGTSLATPAMTTVAGDLVLAALTLRLATDPTVVAANDAVEVAEGAVVPADTQSWGWEASYAAADTDATMGASWTGAAVGAIVGVVLEGIVGPTITVQPTNDVGIISNGQSTVYTGTATGTTISAFTWEVDGSPIADGGIYDIATTGIGTGSASSTLTITRTDKTGTPWDINFDVTDANGTTASNTVTDTWWTGPVLTTFPATDGSGESTATLTCDYVTGVGEAIEVRIPLSDGDVAVTVTTT